MRLLITLTLFFTSILPFAQTPQQLKNIEAFTKLYGYVRYFHPSDEAASIDWNKFAVYGSDKVLKAASDAELISTLNQLFKPVAPTVLIGKSPKFDLQSITLLNKDQYKPVFWFHTGVGISRNDPYSSIRMNRAIPAYNEEGQAKPKFAPFTQSIDALPYRGKEIKLVGKMKADVAGQNGGAFWLRVDRENQKQGFFYNMNDKPITKNEWATYEFTGKVDQDAKEIYFGGFLIGEGTLWADDVKLFEKVNGSDNWSQISIKNGDFELPKKQNETIGWFAGPLAGYAYSINAIEGNQVLEIKSVDQIVEKQTGPLITTIDYKAVPKIGDYIGKKLAPDIEAMIPIVLYGNADHTFPIADTNVLKKLKTDINEFSKINSTADFLAVRLGDVVISWNIFKHFFPYWQDASKNPEEILTQALSKSFKDKTPLDFKRTLELMTEPLNDGHIWIFLEGDTSKSFRIPVKLDWVKGKIVVDEILDSCISGIQPGDIIEKVDGKPAIDIYKEKLSLISGSPQWKSHRAMFDFLTGKKSETVSLSLLHNDHTNNVKLLRNMDDRKYYTELNKKTRKSGEISNGIYYLDLNTISEDSINSWAPILAKAKGIICDLRGYPNGNHNLINYLIKDSEDTKWMFVPKTAYPDQEKIEWYEEGWNMKPKSPHFNGKIVFITDGRAISYAESYMGFIKDFKLATIIGQPTAGTNGNINPFELPGGYYISWTGMMVKNHDRTTHHLKGIVPDIYLERTIKGVVEGRDEFFEKALDIINKSK